jgi:hypothetical protein
MIHVACGACGQWEIVGPGHPSVRPNPETGQHEFFDRTAVLPGCDCPDDSEGSRPLHLTFMAGTAPVTGA